MMTRVEIANDFLAINIKPGTTIQDVIEAAGSGLPFGCRDGECGTCIVEVLQGMDYLSPKNEKEEKVLSAFPDASENARLACQMKVEKANGTVRLKY